MHFDQHRDATDPPTLFPAYKSTAKRGAAQAAIPVRLDAATNAGIQIPQHLVLPDDADLTKRGTAAPLGERIIVTGRVVDEDGMPARNSLIEIWQCNAAGRYAHQGDTHDAPLDPNFAGFGKTLTDQNGRYRFITVKPGAYPWGNHENAWRPAHIHFSLLGNVYAQRLITQMYFPGDPLFAFDPIFNSIPDPAARQRLVSVFKLEHTVPAWALAYEFNIILRGTGATPTESEPHQADRP
jgi:protocatechuate 3,4-dioxygenase, beta subunit